MQIGNVPAKLALRLIESWHERYCKTVKAAKIAKRLLLEGDEKQALAALQEIEDRDHELVNEMWENLNQAFADAGLEPLE